MSNASQTVTITLEDLKALERLAVGEAKIEILVGDFQAHKTSEEKRLAAIDTNIGKIYEIIRGFPTKVNDCRDDLEQTIARDYMTKKDGKMLEQHLANNIKSVKLWIVSSVGGFTAAGVLLLWLFKIIGVHIN
ncbi:MAG: hypothetical protein K0U20_08960 [Proteobacteria bacterium]|nr:hypothetical protein [Pseudomonadota bacterium]